MQVGIQFTHSVWHDVPHIHRFDDGRLSQGYLDKSLMASAHNFIIFSGLWAKMFAAGIHQRKNAGGVPGFPAFTSETRQSFVRVSKTPSPPLGMGQAGEPGD
jgi:hypothetical protein